MRYCLASCVARGRTLLRTVRCSKRYSSQFLSLSTSSQFFPSVSHHFSGIKIPSYKNSCAIWELNSPVEGEISGNVLSRSSDVSKLLSRVCATSNLHVNITQPQSPWSHFLPLSAILCHSLPQLFATLTHSFGFTSTLWLECWSRTTWEQHGPSFHLHLVLTMLVR